MAKLTRYLQKIFANNSNQVGVFGTGTDKETSKNVETLQSADYENGWSSAIITNKNYPIWQERDGVDYGFSYQLAYLMQAGLPEWLSTETYYTNSFCRYGAKIYYSLQDNNINHNPALNDGYWEEFSSGSSRNIGEIVTSTIPLTDAGLHLLDGALIQYGSYSAFVDYIAGLVGTYPTLFDTEANWQTSVAQYGVCGKFVYDSVNNTVRLPKITGKVDGTTDLTALGDLAQQYVKLPNITGSFPAELGNASTTNRTTGAFYNMGTTISGSGGEGTDWKTGFDASRVSSVYSGNGSDTQIHEQAINVLYYIVIATSTKTSIQVDIDEIATDLNGKADVDLTNCTTLATVHCVVEAYVNGTSWYRVYDDGWCEQGGIVDVPSGTNYTVSFLKTYVNDCDVLCQNTTNTTNTTICTCKVSSRTTSGFKLILSASSGFAFSWYAYGYIA